MQGGRDHVAEYRVGGGEQAAEHDQQREGEQRATDRAARVAEGATGRQLAPVDVSGHERPDAEPRAQGGDDDAPQVLPGVAAAQRDAAQAETGQREQDREAHRIERAERVSVAGREVRAQQHGGRREPRRVAPDGDPAAIHQPRGRRRQRHRTEERVQPPRCRAQQRVARDPQDDARRQDLQAEPGSFGERAHPAAASGSPPNRRWRAWNARSASARSAAVKSGHMISVKYSSA